MLAGDGEPLWRMRRMGLLECGAMKRHLRLGMVLLAATMQLVVPVAAYAVAMPAVVSGDFCRASRGALAAPPGQRAPLPSTEHQCMHAPCCVSAVQDPIAPLPRIHFAFGTVLDPVRAWTWHRLAVHSSAIKAAQPRGPPAPL
jgi:hypothetical protein